MMLLRYQMLSYHSMPLMITSMSANARMKELERQSGGRTELGLLPCIGNSLFPGRGGCPYHLLSII